MPHSPVSIVLAVGSFRRKGLAFVQQEYEAAFGTKPPDEPDHLFVAYADMGNHEPIIIGTIGISLWEPDKPIRLARIYEFDTETAPRPVISETIFEYSRLVATRRGISKALIAAASQYALRIGRTCGWCEHTDAVHRICMSFGLYFVPVRAKLRHETIVDGDKEFYKRNPSVRLYMTDTSEWVMTLADSVTYEHGTWRVR